MKQLYGYVGLILLTIILTIVGINICMAMVNAHDTIISMIGFWSLPMLILISFGIVVKLIYNLIKTYDEL